MKDYFKKSAEELRQLFKEPKKICIFVHTNPDGDAMGSALALKKYFTNTNHLVSVVSPSCFADNFRWMPGADELFIFENDRSRVKELIKESDILFGVDFNDFARLNGLQRFVDKQPKTKVIIDHHPFPNIKADYVFSCTSVSSASELTYEFMIELRLSDIDKDIASCIYTGIMTDTGNFSYNDSNPRTYEIVAEILKHKIAQDEIRRCLFQNFTFKRLQLKGFTLYEKLRYLPKYHTAYISLTKDDLAKFDFKIGDTEGFVNLPLSISDVNFTVMFIENDNFVKLSLRSKGDFDVNLFARKFFDGGGHKNAAGGRSFKNMDETLRYFETLLPKFSTQLKE